MAIAFGIKIQTQDYRFSPAPSSTWGLYTASAIHTEFRWIQNDISGLSPEWKSGIIIERGISEFTVEIDLRRGGASNLPGSGSVTIKNSGKFQEFLENRMINLNGLRLEVWELGTGNYQKRIRTYFCSEPEFDNLTFKIPFGGGNENRAANIMNVVVSNQFPYASPDTINKSIPAVFGKMIPVIDTDLQRVTRHSIAKFVRTNDREVYKKYNDKFFCGTGYENTYIFPLKTVFPGRYYYFELRSIIQAGFGSWVEPEDLYLKIVDGVGEGQIRQVEYMDWVDSDDFFCVRVKDFFETELQDDDTDNARSWGQLIEVRRRYDSDHFPCQGFYSAEDEELLAGAEIYVADNDDNLERVAPYGYDIDDIDAAKNKLGIDPLLFDNGNLDTQNSFLILPVSTPHFAEDATLENWDSADSGWFWQYCQKDPYYAGLYDTDVYTYGAYRHYVWSYSFNNLEHCVDADHNTYTDMSTSISSQTSDSVLTVKALYFELPELPAGFTFDSVYVGIKMTAETDNSYPIGTECSIRMMIRRFKYGVKKIMNLFTIDESSGVEYHDIPDFYCIEQDSHNELFFKEVDTNTDKKGYTLFETGISSREEYETYIQGGLFFHRRYHYWVSGGEPDDTKIYELCFIFKKSSDITKEIYSPVHGRVFSYTWDGRKTPTALIEKPADILEHVCRLQNYIDQGEPPVSGWGLQYADLPQIGTSGYGSFDDPDLAAVREYEAAAQIYDVAKGYTDDLKDKICRDFVLANWQDGDGYERVIALPENKLDPVYTIQMSDVLDRKKIKVLQLPDDKIITEPYIKYGFNQVTGEYESNIKVSNASAQSYSSDYVDGVRDPSDAAALWGACHSLYLRTHAITKPSTDQTELIWANGAGGYTIALNYIKNLVNWQFCEEIELPIHYNLCSSWNQCSPVNMLFSHQTDNVSRSALIEKIEVSPNPGYGCTIRAIIYK